MPVHTEYKARSRAGSRTFSQVSTDTQIHQPFHYSNADEADIALTERERGRKLTEVECSTHQQKQLLVDHIEYEKV